MSLIKNIKLTSSCLLIMLGMSINAYGEGNVINSGFVKADLSKPVLEETIWKKAKSLNIPLMAQPMAIPKPATTETSNMKVQSINNGKWISFKLTWKDKDKSDDEKLGKFSDGVALEFPVKVKDGVPPSAFMGEKGNPVHIYHWKSTFQKDMERGGFHEMSEIYPNASVDLYPLEPKIDGNYPKATDEEKMVFSHGRAAGNPQSFPKLKAVDEIYAEGFGTSQVIQNNEGIGKGEWKNGEWSVVITRPLSSKVGSSLKFGNSNFVCFAVWQGGKDETGSRKSVNLSWVSLNISKGK
jgi:hypothetical protein